MIKAYHWFSEDKKFEVVYSDLHQAYECFNEVGNLDWLKGAENHFRPTVKINKNGKRMAVNHLTGRMKLLPKLNFKRPLSMK